MRRQARIARNRIGVSIVHDLVTPQRLQRRTDREHAHPEPDEAVLTNEHGSQSLAPRDWAGILLRAAKRMPADNMPMVAQALAFSTFLAIPSVLLVAVGLFAILTGPATITSVIDHLSGVMPEQARTLLSGSLQRLDHQRGATVVITVVGLVLALWSTTGAMTTYMTALNLAFETKDRRNFLRKRLTALVMVACVGLAFLLVAVFLLFGPTIEKHLGKALGIEHAIGWIWWSAQWPILIAGLLAAFAALLYLGPDVENRRWQILTMGSAIAVVIWLGASAAFAFYSSHFSSYNKTWGSLSAVIVMLMWLWLTGLALLYGAEVNAEARRTRAVPARTP